MQERLQILRKTISSIGQLISSSNVIAILNRIAKKYPPNKVRIEIRNNRFQIRTKEDLAMLLRICNEYYVESMINNNAYVARSKDPIS
jgi:chromosome segregation and condensation protein ScpB